MARPVLLFTAAGAFAALVVAYAAFAWIETEQRVLAAAEAEGRAVLSAVAAGVRSSVDASSAVDDVLARRLREIAGRLDEDLADEAGDLDLPLQAFVTDRGLRGAFVLDSEWRLRAAANARPSAAAGRDSAFDAARVARIEAEQLADPIRRAAAHAVLNGLPLGERDVATLGFGESPFSAHPEYLVARRAQRLGGWVVVRQDAAELARFQARAGVTKLLAEAASGPGIAYLVIVEPLEGRVVASSDPARLGASMPAASGTEWTLAGGRRVLDVALPVGPHWLRVGLAAAPVEDLIAAGHRDLLAFAGVALVADAAVLAFVLQRARRLDEAALRERFASMGRLAAGVAHEVRNPLNALSMAAQRLQREAAPADEAQRAKFTELTGALRAGIARLDATIREFLALGQAGPPAEKAPLDLASLVDEVIAAEGADVRRAPPAEPLAIAADRALLAKAIANLVRNANAIAPGTVAVAWRRHPRGALIEVTDDGPGVDPADRERVFEPFFTKRSGGTGLGLAIAKDAVERQGGTISVDAAPGGGARFAIVLPSEGP